MLIRQAQVSDPELFFQMFRMSATKFEVLLKYFAPRLIRETMRREPIQPPERLCVTLRFLVTGDAFNTVAASHCMSRMTVGKIVKETCSVLWMVLLSTLKKISRDFEERWNFPNCVGAIDGKHVITQCPPRGGAMFFNYKKFHSIVLLATVNANYEFVMLGTLED